MRTPIPAAWSGALLSLLRVVAGTLILMHATQKLIGWPSADGGGGTVPLFSLFWFAGMVEIIGGSLLVLGLFSRWAAFVLAGEMAYAFLFVHAPGGTVLPILNGGEPAVLNCVIFLFLAAAGPGPLALRPDPKTAPAPNVINSAARTVVD